MRWKKTHVKNSKPFIVLLFVHFIILAYTFYKKRDKSYVVLLLSNMGFAYLFEFLVLNLFGAYTYCPKLLRNRKKDNILGSFFSQGIYIPIAATAITALKLGLKWKLLLSSYFVIIEYLFKRWRVFSPKWWKTRYTFVFLILFFYSSDTWYKLINGNHPLVKKISLFLSGTVFYTNGLFVLTAWREMKFGLGWLRTWKKHFIIAPIYAGICSLILVSTSNRNHLLRWILILLVDKLLSVKKMINKNIISLLFPLHLWMMILFTFLDQMLYPLELRKMKVSFRKRSSLKVR